MIKRIIKHKKLFDLVNYKEFECEASFVCAIIFIAFALCINFSETIHLNIQLYSNIIVTLIGAAFGLIGLSLSGVAIIVALFSKEEISAINKSNQDNFEKILVSFLFYALYLGISIIGNILLLLLWHSNLSEPPVGLLYVLLFFYGYFLFFGIFYGIALIGNCIHLGEIKSSLKTSTRMDAEFLACANELRIDLILKSYFNQGLTKQDLLEQLNEMVKCSSEDMETKENLIAYFRSYYG